MRSVLCLFALAAASLAACTTRAREVDDATLRTADADTANWLTHGRTYAEQRHSPLRQVNDTTVKSLGLAWQKDMQTLHGLEATPLVKDGVMYLTGTWSVVYALDAKTGAEKWRYDPKAPKDHDKFMCCGVVNRGVALYRGHVYVGTMDGRLVALDERTGNPVWSVQTTPVDSPYSITGAPRIAGGKVIIGNAGSEYAVRGYVSAYDAMTGAMAWRAYLVPGNPAKPQESAALQRAAATWSGEWWKGGGGASPWDPIVYDPTLDLVYVGTGNPSPWYPELRGTTVGDNLYGSSIVALKASTGEIVWHYQTTPGDAWDYDATQPIVLADLTIDGTVRHVLMQANKNAFFYVIDRATGKLLSAKPFASMTWATGMDSTGRPLIVPSAIATSTQGTIVTPANFGAHNWNPVSFNPTTGLAYLAVVDEGEDLHIVDPKFVLRPTDRTLGRDMRYRGPLQAKIAATHPTGRLIAWDPVAGKEVWRVPHPIVRSGGTLSTAGNLVFQGRVDGLFAAYRATDGQKLWEFDAGVGIAAGAMTYAVGDTQYVAVVTGPPAIYSDAGAKAGPGRLLVFALGGKATLPPPPAPREPIPAPTVTVAATPADLAEGNALFISYCSRCHSFTSNLVKGGAVPDLRRSVASTHAMLDSIVLGGARRTLGMPSFAKDLTPAQLKLIQAYVLDQARIASGGAPR
ncbi:MAG: PQQ-dependent dehydrogenase, methanol/ethanol family [Gemmatimonadaceae bacterium]|nr:PQQ-dependent dehydrogenase, methanol/ethanol family [Gemmatimonadaceae bacterium]